MRCPASSSTLNSQISTLPAPISHLRSSPNPLAGLRICFLAGTLGQGGAERQLFYMLRALREAGDCARVLSLSQGEFWESQIRELGVEVSYVGSSRLRLKRLFNILREVMDFHPDIIQSQHFYTNGYSAVAASLIRARAIGAVRGSGSADMQDCGTWLSRACLKFPHLLAVNSRAAIRVLASSGCPEHKLHYLPNVIDLAHFHPGETNSGHPLTILGIGRLGPEKRFDRFLRVLALLQRSCSVPFRALIVGSGPLRAELEQLAHGAGLYPNAVQFCGSVADVNVLYRKADLLLLTSDHEGTPNVVMEAMASGLPVVATAVGGVPDLVQNGTTGFLAGPNEEQGLAEAISKLLKDDALRFEMSRRARALVEERHSLNSLPAQLEVLYRRVLQREWAVAAPVEAKAL